MVEAQTVQSLVKDISNLHHGTRGCMRKTVNNDVESMIITVLLDNT